MVNHINSTVSWSAILKDDPAGVAKVNNQPRSRGSLRDGLRVHLSTILSTGKRENLGTRLVNTPVEKYETRQTDAYGLVGGGGVVTAIYGLYRYVPL